MLATEFMLEPNALGDTFRQSPLRMLRDADKNMTSTKFGDWRPSISGTRYHYGSGSTAVCGAVRTFTDDTKLRDRCAKCQNILRLRDFNKNAKGK